MFKKIQQIMSPEEVLDKTPLSKELTAVKKRRDAEIADIIKGVSNKMLLIIGPCSADNPDAVCEYVARLSKVQERVKEKLLLIPRIYTNKPRTRGEGYKGILYQPDPHAGTDINAGILSIRKMHIRAISESGLPSADEMLYPDNTVYMDDLLSYVAIGARSSENQQHRLVASGMDIPIGVKNPMNGSFQVLLNSIYATKIPNEFNYNDFQVATEGNPLSHAVLRGSVDINGINLCNYHFEDIIKFSALYEKAGLSNPSIIIDTNHSNSDKDPLQQPRIIAEVMTNRRISKDFGRFLRGFMVESYLVDGAQKSDGTVYGKSITDACIGWEKTERLIYSTAEKV